MDIAQIIQEYGYLAVAIGSFLEGEAVLLSGSFAASQGHLALSLVLPIAALASFLGDLPYFFAGRRYGDALLARFPSLQCRKARRIEHLLHRHHVVLVLSLRFMYGIRIAGLLSLGMSKLSTTRFLCLDLLGAVIWSSAVCAAGYGVGRAITELSGEIGMTEQLSIVAVILLGASLLTFLPRKRYGTRSVRSQRR